mmetsp:Transcript_34518/g.75374  ORF Transcript_34518/g.75374 Transcript_34518/m.75374 type:complete len:235 (-) Transcript_34518:150-854(-)|eukprot:CAMPEP_0116890738 /NCGR_PEP_ID=MMETSP0467-20121206/1255_1 /TAXON_ID=283647 /ORGANISM="Mesodinium pulex, Strain SPMC105" /LENGTH=234 /DNA_ID=CAMNT_0004558755 /DNA_START=42 /DNA_END=746 /DNA_ORIENTATION=-
MRPQSRVLLVCVVALAVGATLSTAAASESESGASVRRALRAPQPAGSDSRSVSSEAPPPPTCWPLSDCNTCDPCCQAYLSTPSACAACEQQSCHAKDFTGISFVTPTLNWPGVNNGVVCPPWTLTTILQAPASMNIGVGDSILTASQVDLNTTDGGAVAFRALLTSVSGDDQCLAPAKFFLSISAFPNSDGGLDFSAVLQDYTYNDKWNLSMALNAGPISHPFLFLEATGTPGP